MSPRARALALFALSSLIACGSTPAGGEATVTAGGGAAVSGAGGSAGEATHSAARAGASGIGGSGVATVGTGGALGCVPFTGGSVMTNGMKNLIPLPVSVAEKDGSFALGPTTGIYVEPSTPEMLGIGRYLADKLKAGTGFSLPVAGTVGPPCAGHLYLTTVDADASLGAEGYQLDVDPQGVRLSAAAPAGLFRGLQTLRQLLPASSELQAPQPGPFGIAAGTIRDYPRFAWRGTMLDVARHFFSVSDVQRLIDLAALYKLSTFHLHLSDDQGFRIAIDSWPNLTAKGASSGVGGGPGGFYTKADYAAIVAYAAARYITIVPEIDLPGHTNAALASYAELSCDGVAPALRTDTDVGYSSLCTRSDTTYRFVSDVVRELSAITPGPYVHLGGDEAKATTVEDFQYFFGKAQAPVLAASKKLIAWDAISQLDSLPAGTVVQFWTSADNARKAVTLGAKVLMSPANKAYLDMQYDKSTPLGQHWAGYIDERTAYEWDPATIVEGVGEASIVGLEAPLWSEFVTQLADLEYMMFPRLAGYAELGWSKASGRSWDEYKVRIGAHGPRLRALGVNFYQSQAIPWL